MNYHEAEIMARGHRNDLLREVEQEYLARLALRGQSRRESVFGSGAADAGPALRRPRSPSGEGVWRKRRTAGPRPCAVEAGVAGMRHGNGFARSRAARLGLSVKTCQVSDASLSK